MLTYLDGRLWSLDRCEDERVRGCSCRVRDAGNLVSKSRVGYGRRRTKI